MWLRWKLLLLGVLPAMASLDLSVAQLQYVSSHLSQADCRRLFAALLTHTYHLDPMVAEAGLILPEDTPCIEMLLHWNFSAAEGRAKNHEFVSRRLRQLGHVELANWLSRTVFHQLAEEIKLTPGCQQSAAAISSVTTAAPYTTTEHLKDLEEEITQQWSPFDSISIAVIICALAALVVLAMALAVKIVSKKSKNTRKYQNIPLYEL